jgi:heme-degrading monooxygenase HmoA
MYARVVYTQVQPGQTDEAIRIYRESVTPVARLQQGYIGGILLTDRGTGKGISISFWDGEAAMKIGETSGYLQQQIGKFAGVIAGPPTRETFEVSFQEFAQIGR